MKMGDTAIPNATQLAAQITGIFQQYFGRVPAAAGLQFWANAVNTGQVDDNNLPLAIVQSAAPADKAFFMQTYPQLGEEIFTVNTPNAGTSPSQGPIVTTTSATTAAAQQAATTAGTDTSGMSMPLMIGIAAVAGYLFWERK